MNETEERRKKIIETLNKSEKAVTGSALAEKFDVSRQVIVQDIAILKAENYKIISTNRGYKLFETKRPSRILKVSHSDEDIEIELNAAVDLGAVVVNVFVWHKAYGKIEVDLNIKSRKDVLELIKRIKSGVSRPLKRITDDYHYHLVEADSEEVLDEVEEAWEKLGIIVKE